MSLSERLSPYQPAALAALRIITALLFIEHGTQKLFGFPPAPYAITTLFFVAGVIELVGGVLILLGLFTRPVAFLLSGEMAIAYFLAHWAIVTASPHSPLPVINGGAGAIMYCFVFLYFAASGPGPWALNQK